MNAAEIQHAEMQSTVGRDCRESLPSSVCERLDSWKEIACYLRRSIRCVQRWEKNEGLPILRRQHARGATVYAYREKLDEWWRGGARNAEWCEPSPAG